MTVSALFDEIREFCRRNADPAIVLKYGRYFQEGYDAYGMDQKKMEAQRDQWLARCGPELGLAGFLDLGDRLVATGKYEEASYAVWFVAACREEFAPETLERLAGWLDRGIVNWAHTDFLCGEVLGDFLLRGIVPLEAFAAWREAPSKWRRRALPVLLIKPLKKGRPVSELLPFVEPLVSDGERVVHQGLGWFLREAWKKDPAPVEDFLLRWKDSCARLIVQYATEKMTVDQKARFRRAKGKK